ncbi:MAG: tryptophan--tRNA ligase, partial [Flavobacteriaceae bacterium]
DSTPLEAPKNPDGCTVFELYQLIAPASSVQALREKYLAGGMGYGYAKQLLFELLLERFEKERERFDYFYQHPEEVHIALAKGAEKARKVAHEVLLRVRDKVGY